MGENTILVSRSHFPFLLSTGTHWKCYSPQLRAYSTAGSEVQTTFCRLQEFSRELCKNCCLPGASGSGSSGSRYQGIHGIQTLARYFNTQARWHMRIWCPHNHHNTDRCLKSPNSVSITLILPWLSRQFGMSAELSNNLWRLRRQVGEAVSLQHVPEVALDLHNS